MGRENRVTFTGSNRQSCQILVPSEVSAQTAFPRTSWRVRVLVVVGRVHGWDVLGKAVWAETEPRSAAEPYIEQSGDKYGSPDH